MKKHTRIYYWTLGIGREESKIQHVHLAKDCMLDIQEADEIMIYGGELNHLIEDAVDSSQFYQLENWGVDKVEHLSDCDLGAENALIRMDEVRKRKLKKNSQTDYILEYVNFWLDKNGIFHHVFGPGDGCPNWIKESSHVEWASQTLDEMGMTFEKRYNLYGGLDSSDILEKMGYIRILGWGKGGYVFSTSEYPNEKQWKSLLDFCMLKNISIPKWNSKYKSFEIGN